MLEGFLSTGSQLLLDFFVNVGGGLVAAVVYDKYIRGSGSSGGGDLGATSFAYFLTWQRVLGFVAAVVCSVLVWLYFPDIVLSHNLIGEAPTVTTIFVVAVNALIFLMYFRTSRNV